MRSRSHTFDSIPRARISHGRKIRRRSQTLDRKILTQTSIDSGSFGRKSGARFISSLPDSSRLERNLASQSRVSGISPAWMNGEIAPTSFLIQYGPDTDPWDYIFEQIEDRDPLTAGMIGRVVDTILAIPRKIIAADETPGALEARDLVKEKFKNIRNLYGGFRAIAKKVANGCGFAEINWTDVGGEIVPESLVYRPMRRFAFVESDSSYDPLLCVRRPGKLEAIPPGKIMYSVYGETDNPWGKGLKEKVYWYWLGRLYLLLDLLLFCERRAKPIPWIKYPAVEESDPEAKQKNDDLEEECEEVAVNLHSNGYAVTTDDVGLSYLGSGQAMDSQSFQMALDVISRAIATLWLHESQTSIPKAMGSYGSYTVLEEISSKGIGVSSQDFAADITYGLIYPIVALNMPKLPETSYPRIVVNAKSDKLMALLLEATRDALNAGFGVPTKQLEENWMIEELEPGDILFKLAQGDRLKTGENRGRIEGGDL